MNKRTNTTQANNKNTDAAIATIETIELERVTGGCSACGCGQPNPVSAQQQQLAPRWPRR